MTISMQAASDVRREATQVERVRQRAYALWEQEGHIHGRNLEHWLQAERELAQATNAQGMTSEAPTTKRRSRSASAKSATSGASAARSESSSRGKGNPGDVTSSRSKPR